MKEEDLLQFKKTMMSLHLEALELACYDLASSVYSNDNDRNKRDIAFTYMLHYLDKAYKTFFPNEEAPSFKDEVESRYKDLM